MNRAKAAALQLAKYGCAQIWNPVDLYPTLNVKIDVRPEPFLDWKVVALPPLPVRRFWQEIGCKTLPDLDP
jgi:hypothetical protein